MRQVAAIALLMFSLASLSVAAQMNLDTCNVVFSQGIRDNYYLLTEREQFETYQSRLCDTQLSSYEQFRQTAGGLNLSVPLAEGLLGLSGSTKDKEQRFSQQYQQFCSSTYFDSRFHDRFQSYISQVSSALTSSWNKCQELQLTAWLDSKGVFAAVTPFGDLGGFVVQVKVKQSGTVSPTIIRSIAPDGAVECRRAGTKVIPNTSIDSNDFELTCSKHPSLEIPFVIETNFGTTPSVNVPAATSKILELVDQMADLRKRVLGDLAAAANLLPIGSIVPYAGSPADAEAMRQYGWWICDGRVVVDPTAPIFNNKTTPRLTDRFIRGGTSAGTMSGQDSFAIAAQTIESRTYGFDSGNQLYSDPRTNVCWGLTWCTGASIASRGTWNAVAVPTVPAYFSAIYLIKVR